MEIGDRVRLLHGKEEGIVRRFIDQKTVEVEIEDGFLIPVLKKELVRIDRGESQSFRSEGKSVRPETPVPDENLPEPIPEIYLALEVKNTQVILWLINQTGNILLYTAHALSHDQYRGLSYGTLPKYTYSKIDSWNLSDQDQWPLLIIDLLTYQQKDRDPAMKISRKLSLKSSWLLKKKEMAPILKVNATLIRLLEEEHSVDPDSLKEAFFGKTEIEKNTKAQEEKICDEEIDLHIESLIKDTSGMTNEEILRIQMDVFEKRLEKAIIHNVNSITFIHGIGNGTLRHKIHKFLGQYPHVKYFEDARKEKFGYGATKVFLK